MDRIADVDVAEAIAHAIGISALRPSQWAHFVKVHQHAALLGSPHALASQKKDSVFLKRKANVLFVVEHVGADVLKHFPHLELLRLSKQPIPIVDSAVLQDSIALMTTLASGLTVAEHGIVGSSWFHSDGSKEEAFSSPASSSRANNLADRLQLAFHGEALVVSASSSMQAASALGGHPLLVSDHTYWKSYSASWNHEQRQFQSTYGHGPGPFQVDLALPNVLRLLPATRHSEHSVSLRLGKGVAHFSLRQPAEMAFLAELELVLSVVQRLKADPALAKLVADSVPDSFSFCFASLRALKASFAPTTDTFQAALEAVDQVMVHVVDVLSKLYADRLMWEVAFLDQTGVIKSGEANINAVAQALVDTNTLAFGIDVFSLLPNAQELCDKLNKLPLQRDLLAVCPVAVASTSPGVLEAHVQRMHSAPAHHLEAHAQPTRKEETVAWARDVQARNGTTSSTSDQAASIVTFQMLFWTTLVMFVMFLFGIQTISNLGIPADSQLVRNMPDIYRPLVAPILRELD